MNAQGMRPTAVEVYEDGTAVTHATETTLSTVADNQTNGNQVVKGANTPSGNMSPTDAVDAIAFIMGHDGTNWEMITCSLVNTDAQGAGRMSLDVKAHLLLFNGTNFDRVRGDITNGLDVDVTRHATSFGKSITYVQVSQGSAGSTQLAAASAGNKHKVVGCFLALDAAGTLLFTDGTISSGAVPLAANTPLVLPTQILPFWETGAVNRALSITTASGKAFGTVAILTEA